MWDVLDRRSTPPKGGPGRAEVARPGTGRVMGLRGKRAAECTDDGDLKGWILCVGAQGTCAALPEAMMATVSDTKGMILPGLIDTHNHILFDIFDEDDWKPLQLYPNHNEWPNELRYQAMLDVKQCLSNDSQGKPAWCAQTNYGTAAGSLRCEMDKWGELKGLIAGTTSIVGLPGTSAACFGSLARSVDVSQNGLGTDGTITTPTGCLYAPQTAITHGTAFNQNEFAAMGAASMKLTWSPRSNAFLYGQTTEPVSNPKPLPANNTRAT
jgi:5-methylthioadenosine/S-adenosylhomocysteine deaminase